MVERILLTRYGIHFEHGAIDQPMELERVLRNKTQIGGQLSPHHACALECPLPRACHDEDQIPFLGVHDLLDAGLVVRCEIFDDVAVQFSVDDPHPCESAEAELLRERDVPVYIVPSDLLSGDVLLEVQTDDYAAFRDDLLVLRQTVGHDQNGVVGGHITVDTDHIESLVNNI